MDNSDGEEDVFGNARLSLLPNTNDKDQFRQRQSSDGNKLKEQPASALSGTYFDSSIHPDYPRFVSAVNDSPRKKKRLPPVAQISNSSQQPVKHDTFILGRTPKELFFCCGFYMLFWGFCIGITFVFLTVHSWATGMVSYDRPRFTTLDSPLSLIGDQTYSHRHYYGNPALGFRPLLLDDSNLIWFIPGEGHVETWAPYVGSIDAFLDHYRQKQSWGCIDCSKKPFPPPPIEDDTWLWNEGGYARKFCCFKVKTLGRECIKRKSYGFVEGKPCILLKLNRIINWMPMLYTNESQVPEEIRDTWDPKYISVKCFGIHAPDKEHIGELKYYPETQGFPFYYYPYRVQKHYRSPLVFVQFLNATPGVLIMVECRAYARNIEVNGGSMMGSVRFELLIDVTPSRNAAVLPTLVAAPPLLLLMVATTTAVVFFCQSLSLFYFY